MNSFPSEGPFLALDLGDRWVGTALSDELGLVAKPHKTIEYTELPDFIQTIHEHNKVTTIVIGYPLTLKGKESEQTKKILRQKEKLATQFPHINFILWDERLTSKQAAQLKKARSKEEKKKLHSIAAAFILQNYLEYRFQTS